MTLNHMLRSIELEFQNVRKNWPNLDICEDGIIDPSKYTKCNIKIMWILKEDYYDSGALEKSYADRISNRKNVNGSPAWRRMSYVSHGIISGERDFKKIKESPASFDSLLYTAIIQLNKDLGESNSPHARIIDGFNQRYKELILLQIKTYKPNVIILGFPDNNGYRHIADSLYNICHGTRFKNGPANITYDGADVGISQNTQPLFLWPYHPSYRRISDILYTCSLLEAYDHGSNQNC